MKTTRLVVLYTAAIALCVSCDLSAGRLFGDERPAQRTARSQRSVYPPQIPDAREEVYRTIGDVSLKCWIFTPEEHKPSDRRACAVFFFGGGWRAGTPGQFAEHCRHLAERGMVAITCDYRVASRHKVLPQECVKDAKEAVRWVRTHADGLGVDPDRIAAGGGSAGGHLAAATGLVPGFESADAAVSSQPNALLLFNPAVILAAVDGHPEMIDRAKLADIRERTDGRPEEISPFHFIRSDLPPAVIFHGTADDAVPYATVRLFQKQMEAAGNRCVLHTFDGRPHGFFNFGRGAGAAKNQDYLATLSQMDAFLGELGYLSPSDRAK